MERWFGLEVVLPVAIDRGRAAFNEPTAPYAVDTAQ